MNTHSVKATLSSVDTVKIVYLSIVNMVNDRELRESCVMYEKDADTIIEQVAKKIAKDYKEISGDGLKLKRNSVDTSVEYVNLNHFNQKRTAYFRRIAVFKIS